MKLAVTFLALVAVATSRHIDLQDVIDLEDLTAYGYLTKIGIPLGQKILEAETRTAEGDTRITGGSLAFLGQFPYQAGLVIRLPGGTAVCGGVLVNSRRVLTAAHCWFDGRNQALSFTVVLGSITLFTGGTRLATSSVVMHENWRPTLIRNDIAMINLPSSVGTSSIIGFAILPSGNQLSETFAGSTARASGFGLTRDGGSISNNQALSWVDLPVITNLQCQLSFPLTLQPTNICASGANGRSTCSGDSGGPLVVNRNGPLLIGIISFGSGRGCQVGAPSAFVRVTSYNTWIRARL